MGVEKTRIARPGGEVGGILSVPRGAGPFPGVVVIPWIKALDEFTQYVVERLADDGFVALGVNIFDHPGVPEDPFQRPYAQPDPQIFEDLDGALNLLKNHPLIKGQPVFAWGYCLGGRFSLLWPTYQKGIAATAAFHGFPVNDTKNPNTPTDPLGRVEHLTCPVIAFFGEADRLVPIAQVEQYRNELKKHGKNFEVHTYPGADHGWTNPKMPAYKKEASDDCWRRAVEFLRRSAVDGRKAAAS
jgi:carboxymethylenebutenolidase